MNKLFQSCCVLMIGSLLVTGCSPNPDASKPVVKESSDKNDHGNEDAHVHGPMGGETFVFGDTGINGEWVAKYNDNLITFYLYGDDKKTEKPVKANQLVASRKVTEMETFEIPASNLENEMASRFEIADETFAIAMKTTGANLEIEIDGVKHTTFLAKDPHAH